MTGNRIEGNQARHFHERTDMSEADYVARVLPADETPFDHETVWLELGGRYRLFSTPDHKMSGVFCREHTDRSGQYLTSSLPWALAWLVAHEEKQHGGERVLHGHGDPS